MKLIPISATKRAKKYRGQFFAQVDDADFEWLNQYTWSAYVNYEHPELVYAVTNINRKVVSMHRMIMDLWDNSKMVDHKDRNSLNNCRSNLRFATSSQNNKNLSSRKGSSSKYLGVQFLSDKKHNRKKPYYASITVNGKRISLGVYEHEQEAAFMYDLAALKYHGEFANFNLLSI